MFGVGIPVTPELAAAIHVGLATLADALAPWDTGSAYLNFVEEPVDPAQFYSADALRAPAPRQGRGRPRGPLPRQPRDRRRLTRSHGSPRRPAPVGSAGRPVSVRSHDRSRPVAGGGAGPQDHGAHDDVGAVIVVVQGEIDIATVDALRARLADACEGDVTVDLRRVELPRLPRACSCCSSSTSAAPRAASASTSCRARRPCGRLFELTGTLDRLSFVELASRRLA